MKTTILCIACTLAIIGTVLYATRKVEKAIWNGNVVTAMQNICGNNGWKVTRENEATTTGKFNCVNHKGEVIKFSDKWGYFKSMRFLGFREKWDYYGWSN